MVRRLRLPPLGRVTPLAVLGVTAAAVMPARAAIRIAPGQEFVYSGTAALTVTNPAG